MATLYWHRNDLRLRDNPALSFAADMGPVLPVFICDPDEPLKRGEASRWWLHHSLKALDKSYRGYYGAGLAMKRGNTSRILDELIERHKISHVVWSRRYEPGAIAQDTDIKATLKARGIDVTTFNGSLLHEPFQIKNKQDKPFQVFTPFWKHCLTLPVRSVVERPAHLKIIQEPSDDLGLLPSIQWHASFDPLWTPGEEGAQRLLKNFTSKGLDAYATDRNRPDMETSTSKLSPHLHVGDISPTQIWHAVQDSQGEGRRVFLSEIGWREFSYNLLYYFPRLRTHPLKDIFLNFEWEDREDHFKAWTRGQTGYPIVDAGMRQLWQTGWMHNRVRMIVASFLVKHLLIPWQKGEEWFWDTLVDADPASNAASWQWVAGSGADAAPYFRIFNPILQGQKFDPRGDYVRQYVPELQGLTGEQIHAPWTLDQEVLRQANIHLGTTYPNPMVDHGWARERALLRYEHLRQ